MGVLMGSLRNVLKLHPLPQHMNPRLVNMIDLRHTSLPDHPFWHFSLEVYQRPSVEKILLHLQQHYDLNINVILFCCWWASSGQPVLDSSAMRRLLAETALWHRQVIVKLRSMRNWLKNQALFPQAKIWRQMLLAEELFAEHIEQLMLADIFIKLTANNKAASSEHIMLNACHNLQLYFAEENVALSPPEIENLCLLMTAIFPDTADDPVFAAVCREIFVSAKSKKCVEH